MDKRLFLFIIGFLVLFFWPRFFQLCPLFPSLSFDSQAGLTWYAAALQGLLPYRDVFYPYGFLVYYRDISVLGHMLYEAIMPVSFLLTFYLFQKIWKSKLFSLLSFFVFFLFTTYFNGEAFISYGLVTVVAASFALIFVKKALSKKLLFLIGAGCGLLFSVLHPQGLYIILLFLAGLCVRYLIQVKDKFKMFSSCVASVVFFFSGIIVGLVPFIFYLLGKGIFGDFIFYLTNLSNITQYAKTPFIPFSTTPPNLFTFSMLIVCSFYLAYRLFFSSKKMQLREYMLIQLFITLVFLENISIIRSIDGLITFIPVFILIILASKVYDYKKLSKKFFFFAFIIGGIILFFALGLTPLSSIIKKESNLTGTACLEKNKLLILAQNPEYANVVKKLKSDQINKIFSFPADPNFYILFDQRPPYYFNNYDSSSLDAQQKQITYIEKNKINTIIYNLSLPKLQDEVPNYVRTPKEFSYIVNNFEPVSHIGNFMILNKTRDMNFKKQIVAFPDFYKSVFNFNLENIPASEGRYKKRLLEKGKVIIRGANEKQIDTYLKENKVESKNTLLLIRNLRNEKRTTVMVAADDIPMQISFRSCIEEFCVINLNNLPLFYNNRRITTVNFQKENEISFIKVDNLSLFW